MRNIAAHHPASYQARGPAEFVAQCVGKTMVGGYQHFDVKGGPFDTYTGARWEEK